MRWLVIALCVVSAPLAACGDGCGEVTRTIPAPGEVLGGADAVVRARLIGFREVREYTLEAEIEVSDVLVQVTDPEMDSLQPGPLVVGAFDHRCFGRTGLREGRDTDILVVLNWIGPNWSTFDGPWRADPVLVEHSDGTVEFIDQINELNPRIDQILPETTVQGVVDAVVSQRQPSG